jgi:hypothetical protein
MTQESIWSSLLATYQLEPLPGGTGTRLQFRARLLRAPSMKLARPMLRLGLSRKLKRDFEHMASLMAAAEVDEPAPVKEAVEPQSV